MADWFKKIIGKAVGDTQADLEPLVLAENICRQVEEKIQVVHKGRKIFPFNSLTVQFYSPDAERQELLRAAFVERNDLQTSLREFLERQEVPDAGRVRVRVEIISDTEPPWADKCFNIIYHKKETNADQPPPATLTVLKGRTARPQYTLKLKNKIGRTEEVLDRFGKLVRRNDIIFEDNGDDVTSSVSRIQSRIEYDADKDAYILFDDNSKQGTSIERDGRVLEVSGLRGIALRNGDVIYFGMARARFETP